MACQICQRAASFRAQLETARESGAATAPSDLLITASSGKITLKDATVVPLNRPLLRDTKRPSGGWGVRFVINGIEKLFEGKTGFDVFNQVTSYLSLNGLQFTAQDVWLNLNLQWYARTSPQWQLAVHAALSELIAEHEQPVVQSIQRGAPVSEWLPAALTSTGHYLGAPAVFTVPGFLQKLGEITEMLNPSSSNGMGNTVLYAKAVALLSGVRSAPPASLEGNRVWFSTYCRQLLKALAFTDESVDSLLSTFHWQ